MKRIKIMLMAICMIAIAGGVLAFKARTAIRHCTVTSDTNGNCVKACPNLVTISTKAPVANYFCTTLPVVYNGQTTCTYKEEDDGPTLTVDCNGSATLSIEGVQ